MRYSVDYRGTNYSGSVDMDQLDGTCGIVLATYLMPNDLTILDRCENTRRAVAKLVGQQMMSYARESNYGQLMVGTVAKGKFFEADVDNEYDPYSPNLGDDHFEDFNLGTIARAVGGTPGVTTHNFNSGNEVVTYTIDCTGVPRK